MFTRVPNRRPDVQVSYAGGLSKRYTELYGLRETMIMHEWIVKKEAIWLFYLLAAELLVSLYSAIILTVEYFWGRSDTDIKREAVRKKKQKLEETQPSTPGETK